MSKKYQAVLLVSFGGPEGNDDVMPFLDNVLRGRNVPRERMLEVAEHYYHFGGKSPINDQCRELLAALETEFREHGTDLKIYWGNRNWHPMLEDTIRQMKEEGITDALCLMTSGFSSYSGCRQYREDVIRVCERIGDGAPKFDKIRVFYNHPDYVEVMAGRVKEAMQTLSIAENDNVHIIFTAHSLPVAMADNSDYVKQLTESSRLVAEQLGNDNWDLVYQSRSGPPTQPWLEPDICDHLQSIHDAGGTDLVIVTPIGFISDHMEVVYDLDTEAKDLCEKLGLSMARAKTAGAHPRFISMLRELVMERVDDAPQRACGQFPPNHDVCPVDCCLSGRPQRPA